MKKQKKRLEEKLSTIQPNIPWSVKNQARMHKISNLLPYSSSEDGISKFPETATALGIKLEDKDRVKLTAPWGIEDAIRLKVKPTPMYCINKELFFIYEERVKKKNWQSIWNKIEIYYSNHSIE
ncbi:nucleotidyltransferase family protein [Bacillus carboniphilus]|uniref:nucleotidyltransferase family protein n=1 Tax=Bacillus carboniphilus TaxID=86663 RepID=UPI0035318356